MAPSPFKESAAPYPFVLTKWRLIVDSLVDDIASGTVSRKHLRWLEDNICNFMSVSAWCEYRKRIVESDPGDDREEIQQLLRLQVKGTELWYGLIEKGLVESVETAQEGWVSKVLRVIATILLEPKMLTDFMAALLKREVLPAWVEQGLARNKANPKTRPIESETLDRSGSTESSTA